MPFTLIPALDVAGGRLVTWTDVSRESRGSSGGDPAQAAARLARTGARWLHVVDVDHALDGGELDRALFRRIRAETQGVRVQASGGLLHDDVRELLDEGSDRAVLASAALADREATVSLLEERRGHVVVGIEVRDGVIRGRGREPVELDLMGTLGWLTAAAAERFLVTAISRVGALGGPDVATIRRAARAGRPVLAAGGISSLEDLRAARAAGAAGAVVGRAALDGSLDLRAAFSWADVT